MQYSASRFKLIVGIICIALIVWVGYAAYSRTTFHIVSTNPNLSAVATSTVVLKADFSRTLSRNGLSLSSTDNIVDSSSVSGKTLNIKLKSLNDKQTYTVTIRSITAIDSSHLSNQKLTFTAHLIDFNTLPKDQQQAILQQQQQRTPTQSDPILSHLPYATLDYRLDPVFTQDQLVIQAQLYYLPTSDVSEADQLAQAKQEALAYISSLGLDPASYNLQYQTVTQTLQGT